MCIKKTYLLFTTSLLFALSLFAQSHTTKIQILHANSLQFNKAEGSNAKKLIGDVQLRHDTMLMYCDSAYVFDEQNSMDAYGNVRIVQGDSLRLYGDSLFYDGDTKVAKLRGNITLKSPGMQLTTKYLDYNRIKNTAYYRGGGKLIKNKDNTTLTSKDGIYYSNTKDVLFKDSVRLKNKDYNIKSDSLIFNNLTNDTRFLGATYINNKDGNIYCRSGWYNNQTHLSKYTKDARITTGNRIIFADTIYLNQAKGEGRFFCNVSIKDTANNLNIFGEKAFVFQKNDSAVVTQNALLIQSFSNDSLFLHADTFKVQTITTKTNSLKANHDSLKTGSSNNNRILYAYHHVKFFKTDMQGKCDSLVYSFPDSLITMYKSPVLWSDSSQLTADTISIMTYDTVIHSLYLRKNAFIISQVDTNRFNEIQGVTMHGTFSHNKLSKILVHKQAATVYYALDDNKKYIGVNKATANDLLIHLSDNKIKSLTFIHSPEATLYPLEDISPEKLKFKGFHWRIDEKPRNKFDVFE